MKFKIQSRIGFSGPGEQESGAEGACSPGERVEPLGVNFLESCLPGASSSSLVTSGVKSLGQCHLQNVLQRRTCSESLLSRMLAVSETEELNSQS